MRMFRTSLALSALLASVATASDVRAQTSLYKPAPNLLLLVDTSGSMERKQDGKLPTCTPGAPASTNERSKWIQVVEGLTGDVENYSCVNWDRKKSAASTFQTAYKIAGKDPLDYGYDLPHVVPLSGTSAATACGWAPYSAPGAAAASGVGPANRGNGAADASVWDNDALKTFPLVISASPSGSLDTAAAAVASTCFSQLGNGQLDQAQDLVRLGLMTFDTDEGDGTGLAGTQLSADPFLGGFSYLSGRTGAGPATVTLPACAALTFEVGARNEYAPPWEGRMVPFPVWNASGTAPLIDNSNRIQNVLLGSRPFGATPMAGLLRDAQRYLLEAANGPAQTDDYVKGLCRDQFVVLITDGEATLDMRPACVGASDAGCPYKTSREIVTELYAATPHIRTFVVGFSVTGTLEDPKADTSLAFIADPTKRNCKDWYASVGGTAAAFSAECTSKNPAASTVAHACCSLAELAQYGSDPATPSGPLFAESQGDLNQAFASVIASIATGNNTRALPTFGSSLGNTLATGKTGRSALFLPNFTPKPLEPWSGDLVRVRQVCTSDVPTDVPASVTDGDSLSAQVTAQTTASTRRILTVTGATDGSAIESFVTVRPFGANGAGAGGLKSLDGLRTVQAAETTFTNGDVSAAVDAILKESFSIDEGTDDCPASGSGTTAVPALTDKKECATSVLGFAVATPTSMKFATTHEFNIRCPSSTDCTAFGGLYHSTPTVTPQPLSFLGEAGYRIYADDRKNRPQIVYFATTDGLLHAFDSAIDSANESRKPSELFAFMPPASVARLRENYRTKGTTNLLDGPPVTKEVVWDRLPSAVDQASAWHTSLVAGLGQAPGDGSGYYALDVTDVADTTVTGTAKTTDPYTASNFGPDGPSALFSVGTAGTKAGPHFLWQLTSFDYDDTGTDVPGVRTADSRAGRKMARIFGEHSGTPAIATLFLDPGDSKGTREVGVAILPGGYDDDPTKSGPRKSGADFEACERVIGTNGTLTGDFSNTTKYPNLAGTTYPARKHVRKWASGCDKPVAGRTLSIVRLDTGQILRTFARKTDVPRDFALATGPLTETPFDSPVTGTPIPFPFSVGEVAKRIYVSDADGTIWSVDVANTDPKKWSVGLFFDTASPTVTGAVDTDATAQANASRPVNVAPVLAVDDSGSIILNVAAGDPEQITADSSKGYVYSLRERPNGLVTGTSFPLTELIWFKTLENGSRVTGPMAVFDRTLYFATFTPSATNACGGGSPFLWGMDTLLPTVTGGGSPDPTGGGLARIVPNPAGPLVQSVDLAASDTSLLNRILPGVTVRQVPSCIDSNAASASTVFGQSHGAASPKQSTSFEVFTNVPGKAGTSGIAPSTFSRGISTPDLSKIPLYDSWVTILE